MKAFFFFLPCHRAWGNLSPWARYQPLAPCRKPRHLDGWTPGMSFFFHSWFEEVSFQCPYFDLWKARLPPKPLSAGQRCVGCLALCPGFPSWPVCEPEGRPVCGEVQEVTLLSPRKTVHPDGVESSLVSLGVASRVDDRLSPFSWNLSPRLY